MQQLAMTANFGSHRPYRARRRNHCRASTAHVGIAAQIRHRRYMCMATLPPADRRRDGPVRLSGNPPRHDGEQREGQKGHNLAFGRFERAGEFASDVTRPDLFADYLATSSLCSMRHYDPNCR
jgi:hypothetical protein